VIKSDIISVLEVVHPHELADSLLTNYENALSEYKKSNWMYFGNEIGQFIEVARRIIEHQLDSKYTPLSDMLKIFNEKVLLEWENHNSEYPEVYRVIIPRCLYAMYCLRNKRGMIHKNHIDPNKMDATVLLGNTKWVLAELFRIASMLPFEDTEAVINAIMSKETSIVWDVGNCLRILDTKMCSKNKVLCLLYIRDGQTDTELRNSIEYKNVSDFKKLLKSLHKNKFIEYSNSKCLISPVGIDVVEKLLSN
jgi:hypothetical protein